MTGDIVGRLLHAEPDCEVVNGIFTREQMLEAIREHRPSIVIVGLTDADVGPQWDELFQQNPDLPVLAVTPHGHRACLFREPVVQGLLAAVRTSAEGRNARA
jgi:DNA-binding NarL/FixJ family response regulator